MCTISDICILINHHRQAAIVRGAALGGLQDIQPSSRRARMHYGIDVTESFDPVIHQNRDRYTDDWDGSDRADHQVLWELPKVITAEEQSAVRC